MRRKLIAGQKQLILKKLVHTELRPIIEKCEVLSLTLERLAAQN